MITEDVSNLLSKINWDYNYSEKELLQIIHNKENLSPERLSLIYPSI